MTPQTTESTVASPSNPQPPIPQSQRGDWTWELVAQFPRQGEWTERDYLNRSFEGLVEFSHGVLDFIHPLYPPEDGGPPRSQHGDWTWEVVAVFPRQGEWTERQYLGLPEEIRSELKSGCLEFLPMPTWIHAWIIEYLHDVLKVVVKAGNLGRTAASTVSVRTTPGNLREPDVVYLKPGRIPDPRKPSNGADLIIEVVSEGYGDRQRDYEEKRVEYAAADIPEYWIVDPQEEVITVLTLPAGAREYTLHGEFRKGQQATSVLLPGFVIDVTACFAAGNPES